MKFLLVLALTAVVALAAEEKKIVPAVLPYAYNYAPLAYNNWAAYPSIYNK